MCSMYFIYLRKFEPDEWIRGKNRRKVTYEIEMRTGLVERVRSCWLLSVEKLRVASGGRWQPVQVQQDRMAGSRQADT